MSDRGLLNGYRVFPNLEIGNFSRGDAKNAKLGIKTEEQDWIERVRAFSLSIPLFRLPGVTSGYRAISVLNQFLPLDWQKQIRFNQKELKDRIAGNCRNS